MPSKGENLSCKIQGNQICKDTELLRKSFSYRDEVISVCLLLADEQILERKCHTTKEFGAQVTQR